MHPETQQEAMTGPMWPGDVEGMVDLVDLGHPYGFGPENVGLIFPMKWPFNRDNDH